METTKPAVDWQVLPVDTETIQARIQRAATVTAVLPQYQDLVVLEQLLRGHLNLLLPIAQEHTDRLDRGSAQWHRQQTTIDRARRTLAEGMGEGLMSAAAHVQELSRSCRFLLNWQCGEKG